MRNKMQFADRQTVERLRREFPKGCRIVLDAMITRRGDYNLYIHCLSRAALKSRAVPSEG